MKNYNKSISAKKNIFLIDSHCHIDLLDEKKIHHGIDDILKKSTENNIGLILTISTSIKNFLEIKKKY